MEPSTQSATEGTTRAVPATQYLPPPRPGTTPAGEADGACLAPSAGSADVPGGTPVTEVADSAPRWSRTSLAALAGTAVLLAGAVLTHSVMLFLTLAPPNVLTVRHRGTVDAYVQPEFGQDWKLFAPNPKQRNDSIGVRLRTAGSDGSRGVSPWINLTARDVAVIQGHPAPSHVHQNMLRIAWDNSESWHGPNDRPKGVRGAVAAAYLKRVVLQRIGRRWKDERITGIQIAGRYEMVPPPSWSSEEASDTTTYRVLPWWPVTDQDYKGL
ncbi:MULTISPECIES: DUF5819 family protein [unclassified Streptomyces]|uniref:DUF5819 family protein n=1 Tax=unclassified Streptomyces TaxID=2593676 RepID=UPI00339DDEE1